MVSHSDNTDTGMIWMTAAETFMDTYKSKLFGKEGILVDLATETGRMEFFLFGSGVQKLAPKRVAKIFSQIVGT